MICNFNRYYINADYKSPYCDYKSPHFIALTKGCMFDSLEALMQARADWKKDKKLHNFRFSIIPAGSLEHIELTFTEGAK